MSLSLPVPDERTARNFGVLAAVAATSGQRRLVSLLVDRISSLQEGSRLECILTSCIFRLSIVVPQLRIPRRRSTGRLEGISFYLSVLLFYGA